MKPEPTNAIFALSFITIDEQTWSKSTFVRLGFAVSLTLPMSGRKCAGRRIKMESSNAACFVGEKHRTISN